MYTEEFIQRVLDLYPDNEYIRTLAESGQYALGRELRIGSDYEITPRDIIAADNLEDLQRAAIKLQLRKQLYNDFIDGKGSIPSPEQAHFILAREEKNMEESG